MRRSTAAVLTWGALSFAVACGDAFDSGPSGGGDGGKGDGGTSASGGGGSSGGESGGGGTGGEGGAEPPARLAGTYTIAATNGENGCKFDGWETGKVTEGVPFTIEQKNASVTGTLGGAYGVYAALFLGSATFTGEVEGSDFTMTDFGTKGNDMMGCHFTINALAEGTLTGDAIQGKIFYIPKTNGSPDCGKLNDCKNTSAFSGTRPPQ